MAEAIQHRGPDDEGTWNQIDCGVGFAHRRLAIVDLSPGGHQPMVAASGRHVIAFNGEIYNHHHLRVELEAAGVRFRSTSDTEVLVEAIALWGVEQTCRRLTGMFAFAVWDQATQSVWLARDRIGKKPLYYWKTSGGHVFASELKALWAFPGFHPEIDKQALAEYLRYGYVSEHLSIFEQVAKVLPGEVVRLSGRDATYKARFWSLSDVVDHAVAHRIEDPVHARQELLALLKDATCIRMLADVPLGAFLSGGIDSGLVVSLMQDASMRKVRTFSIGFHEATFNEAHVARAVAGHLGTDHTELYVDESQALDLVPRLADIFDEPFADASQIPTSLLALLTRQEVTVALTGDGGDESFGGYARYRNEYGLLGQLYRLPAGPRHLLAQAALSIPASTWDHLVNLMPERRRLRFPGSKVAKFARALNTSDAAERGKSFLSFWDPEQLILESQCAMHDPFMPVPGVAIQASEQMQFWETQHYLPGDLLAKVDRATMAASLEARCPLLDHRVVEFSWRLPETMKASRGSSKRILRDLLFQYVPAEIIDLPKQGFSVPIGAWMRTNLNAWARDALAYGKRELGDLLDWRLVETAWTAHLSGKLGHAEKMWIVLMFCQWHRRWFGQAHRPAIIGG